MFFDKKLRSYFLASVSASAMLTCISAHANPEGATVVTGDVAVGGLGSNNVIIQNNSARSIVNWNSFSIGTGEVTTINQVTNNAAILNRVTGGNISEIYGTLNSNGQVYLINESGILIGQSGLVNTNGFVASTLDMSNADFLGGGDMLFKQGVKSGGGITVHGKIRSVSGGDIFLLSREITIGATAEINANGGYVGLGAGEEILLRAVDSGDGRISIRAGKGKITNQGTIEGVAAELRAAGGNEYALAINNTGVIRAKGVSRKGGRILLTGGGKVRNSGKLLARKKVVIRSKKKIINKGQVKAGDGNKGGEIIFEAPEIEVNAGSLLDVAGALGGGRVFIGGGYQGTNADHDGNEIAISENATSVTIDSGATIDASATQSGDAGEIVVWADGSTKFSGDLRASAVDGAGGRAEVSGKETLSITGISVDLSGTTAAGHLLLDPEDVHIVTAIDGTSENQILDSAIETILEGGASVTITTDTPFNGSGIAVNSTVTGGPGDVTFDAGVRIQWVDQKVGLTNQDTTFTVHAAQDIIAADDVIIQHSEEGTGAAETFDPSDPSIQLTLDNVIDNNGGITFLAARDIKIGSDGTARTGGVAIGSEFGATTMVAGDSNFDGAADQVGDVLVTGGKGADAAQTNYSAQIGYVSRTQRANNTGNDHADVDGATDFRAVNGNINVSAGRHVAVTGGVANTSFAQIGHGGYADAEVTGAGTIDSASQIVDSKITVTSGVVAGDPGDVTLTGGDNNAAFAKIGHGAVLQGNSQLTLTQSDISGDIGVTASNGGSIKVNETFTATQEAPDDFQEVRAQIGHGATLLVEEATTTTFTDHGKISGNIAVDADASFIAGAAITAVTDDDRYAVTSQVGHGAYAEMSGQDAGGVNLTASFDRITEFTDLAEDNDDNETTNISVTAADILVRALETTQNSANAANDARKVDNLQRSIVGHGGSVHVDESGKAAADSTGKVIISVVHQDIAGNITLSDDTQNATGITVNAGITGTDTATTDDVMIARVGHATSENIHTRDGGEQADSNGVDGGSVIINQAHILGSRIRVSTGGVEANDEDISLITNITAGVAVVEDSTAVAQIGHSADTFVKTGKGGNGAAANAGATYHSGNAGDIRIEKGTVSDGLRHYTLNDGTSMGTYGDNGGLLDDDFNSSDDGNTDIIVLSSNQIKIDSDTAAALAGANRNNAESSIGHGHKQRLMTGDGGTNGNANAGHGGRGGDIQINQRRPGRDFGDLSTPNFNLDALATGLRGEIVLGATHTADAEAALSITSDDASSATAATNNNSDVSTVGHGDFIEMATGKGGDGGTTANVESDQRESFGGRGGHIDVNLSFMTIESDIQLTDENAESIGGITGAIEIKSKSANAVAVANRALVESVIGHSERIFGHTGDGGKGGTADNLANATAVVANAAAVNSFQQDLMSETAVGGASRGGNGGDISIQFGGITDRVGQVSVDGGLKRRGEADIHVEVAGYNTTANSLNIIAEVGAGTGEGNGADVFAGIGHHTRLYGEGGKGGDGGVTHTQFDISDEDATFSIQPDASGGRGGDVQLSSGNITGDVVVDVTRQAVVDSIAGHGTFTKVIAGIGHTTDLVAVTQNGGNGANLTETDNDGGIDAIDHVNTNVTAITLVDRNDDDKFDLSGVDDNLNDADDTSTDNTLNEDGIDTNGDGVVETFTTLGVQLGVASGGSTPNDTGGVIYHDEEGDPAFILDAAGELIANDSVTGTPAENSNIIALRSNVNNLERFGRTVGNYEADFNTTDATVPMPHFVDIDQDGDVDFVDFDADGRIDIVDIDRDGVYDEIDGRSSPSGAGFSILDYTAVTGVGYSQTHVQGGWELADFSTSNGGRGGDAQTSVGMTMGHVAVDVGDPTKDVADSLIVRSTVTDATSATGGARDVSIARIGHGAFQMSDTGGSYDKRAAGRTEVDMDGTTQGHSAANGGDAGEFAINGNGGDGGDATVTQGASRDIDPRIDAGTGGNLTVLETDHLVGNIYVNNVDTSLPTDMRIGRSNHSDSKRISVLATADNDAGTNISVAQIGHGSQAAATAGAWTGNHGALVGAEGNTGGIGASNGGAAPASSQTELANGGNGGDATLTQNQIKGTIDVRTGADNGTGGDNDFSVEVKATKGPATAAGASNNIVTAQIGHGRIGMAVGGKGGIGDDGQLSGNGGRGGDATATQTAIIDTSITIDLVDSSSNYYGNGLWVDSTTQLGSQQIVRGQVGHGDLVFAEGGAGGNGSAGGLSDVIEQRNQTVNGGRGGDATINQHGYNYDITLDIGPNGAGPDEALKITSHVDTTNVGTNNHTFAAVGHGGYAEAITNKGGDGGNRNGARGISNSDDPNLRDGVDATNRIKLGTDRNGGRGGNAVSNIGVNGTGRTFSAAIGNDRTGYIVVDSVHNSNSTNTITNPVANGLNSDGADILITLQDDLSGGGAGVAARDGVLVEAKTGQGDTQDRAIDTTTAIIGHTGYNRVDATAAVGGKGIQSTLGATISEGDGGDGGSATATTGFVIGKIYVDNRVGDTGVNAATGVNATDIIIRAVDQTATDGAQHRADARIGHMVSAEALSGAGGDSSIPGAGPEIYPATISTRGGDGGDANVSQGSLSGSTTLIAEGSIQVLAADGTSSSPTLAAAVGHRSEADAVAAVGGLGGLSQVGSQNLYFIYEALREFDLRIKGGATQEAAFNALSSFEQKLVAPFYTSSNYRANTRDKHGYYDDKYIGHFLDKMLDGQRDDNFITGDHDNDVATPDQPTNNTIQALSTGDSGEERTLLSIMAASGDGGHTSITQGSTQGVADGNNFTLNPINDSISLTANSFDTDNTERGIIVRASDGAAGGGFQIAHVGHQNETIRAHAGDAAGVRAYSNGIGGDGGDASVTQYEHSGKTTLTTPHRITVEATDGTSGAARQRAWVGHRQTIAPDRPSYRTDPVVKSGDGGSELSNLSLGRNGNGGDINVIQRGATTGNSAGTTQNDLDILLSTSGEATDDLSIVIKSSATGATSDEAETHIGHDVLLASAKAGDAGQMHALHGPSALDEGVLEGNGGDIRIQQTDLGADIDIIGRDGVDITAASVAAGSDAHTILGHERTIGESADLHGDRTGTIVAGIGGDSKPEDFNDSSEINPVSSANGTSQVEDGDGGNVYISTGTLTDALNKGTTIDPATIVDSDGLVTITSQHEDVDVESSSNLGKARIEIGNQQHVTAVAGRAGLHRGTTADTAGDGGDVRITRGEIGGVATDGLGNGDILIQALDLGSVGDKEVNITSVSTAGLAETLLGHEVYYDVTSGHSGYGNGAKAALIAALKVITDLDAATASPNTNSAADQEATLREANAAYQAIQNTVRAIALAQQNADRLTTADANTLNGAKTQADTALTAASAALSTWNTAQNTFEISSKDATDIATLDAARVAFINDIRTQSAAANTAIDDIPTAVPDTQIADHADGGDILYTATNALSSNATVSREGYVAGNVNLISGEDTTSNNSPNDFNGKGVVIFTSTAAAGAAQTEAGHRRTMTNTSGIGGGETDGANPDGGDAGDGGNITVTNVTTGDTTLTSDEVVVRSLGGGGTAEAHLLHDVEITNKAGKSDIESKLGNGGDITVTQNVSGGATLNANHLSSAKGAEDSKLGAEGDAVTLTHLGHQVELDNDSDSDEGTTGNGTADANRGGAITVNQSVAGATTDGDLVSINLALTSGNVADLTIDADSAGKSVVQLGNNVKTDSRSGNPTDDGGSVSSTQAISGDLETSGIEDLLITVKSTAAHEIQLGHTAEQNAQSGDTNGSTGNEYGEVTTATQTVSGNVTLGSSRTFEVIGTAGAARDIQIGHEATQLAKSANDTSAPPDGTNNVYDVNATQTIQAQISVVTGGIYMLNADDGDVHLGHEAFITVDTDADGQVKSRSRINPAKSGQDDIILTSTGTTGAEVDTKVTGSAGSLAGNIELSSTTKANDVQVGHRSTSFVSSDGTQANGVFDTEQSIGGTQTTDNLVALNSDGTVANTAASTITVNTHLNLIVGNAAAIGDAQIGHHIEEKSDLQGANAVTATGSTVRQTVGSDIVIGSNAKQGSGGVGTGGVGNNLVVITDSGRSMIGHNSPASNQWQTDGGRSVTPQILDGNITVEAGTDAGVDAPNGVTSATNTTATGDDILLQSGGGTARIGHNMTGQTETVANETQKSAGDVWVRAGGDLHVLGGAIGHEDYVFDDIGTSNKNATPESLASTSPIRDRIRGNTTVAAGQNSSAEDSTLISNIMVFNGSTNDVRVNSGYGGIGNRDVDGELRFFLPAQQNLTIVPGVAFNDSASNGDAVTARLASASNVFEGTGGNNHEHEFAFAAAGTNYADAFIGGGNFAFYFETPPVTPTTTTTTTTTIPVFLPEYTPTFIDFDSETSFSVIMTDPKSGGSVNIGSLGQEGYFGTSSFEIACEEQGIDPQECESTNEHHNGLSRGLASNASFSGTAGGNQSSERVFDQEVGNRVNQLEPLNSGYILRPLVAPTQRVSEYTPASLVKKRVNQKAAIQTPRLGTFTELVRNFRTKKVANSVSAYQGHIRSAAPTTPSDSYGEYVTGVAINTAQVERKYPDSLSYASSFNVYKQQ